MRRKNTLYIGLLLVMLFVVGTLSTPMFVSAQENTGVVLLEPSLFGQGEGTRAPQLGDYLENIFRLGIGVATALAVLMIVLGGVEYMGSDSVFKKDAGKEKIQDALWGLLLALGAFLLLQTINPALVRFDIVQTLDELKEKIQDTPLTTPTEGVWQDDSVIRDVLSQKSRNGVVVNKPNCTYVGQTNCTSLTGFPIHATNRVANLALNDCHCSLRITAGTEYWLHGENTRHGPGNAVLDLSPIGALNKYITGNSGRPSLQCFEKITKNGVLFQWEGEECAGSTGDHWHVEF